MQRVRGIAGPGVLGARIDALQHLQAGRTKGSQQLGAAAQADMLSQVGQNQSAFAARGEVRIQALQKARQHGAAFVVHRRL